MMLGLYPKLIGIGVIVVAVVGGYFYVTNLQDKVESLTEDKKTLERMVSEQNTAIDGWKKEADDRLVAGQEALKIARAETAKAKGRATIIYRTRPSTPGDSCASALDLVNGLSQ